jgi:hypothetical protein
MSTPIPAVPVVAQNRRAWSPPALEALPKLTDLTLQTGAPIPGGGGPGGTVF